MAKRYEEISLKEMLELPLNARFFTYENINPCPLNQLVTGAMHKIVFKMNDGSIWTDTGRHFLLPTWTHADGKYLAHFPDNQEIFNDHHFCNYYLVKKV